MQPLSLGVEGARLEILCIGAHCDDIEIGCGGTVLSLQRRYPDCRIHWLVMTSIPVRRLEALAAMKSMVGTAARGETWIGDLPDGLLPARFEEMKAQFETVRRAIRPDLVLTHHGHDRHQDHALVCEMTWQTFRDHMIWEYEIPKYDGDLATPGLYVPLPATVAKRKVATILRTFRSQARKPWLRAENLLAVMHLRGLECRSTSGYAEAFHCRKLVFDAGGGAAGSDNRARTKGRPTGRSSS
jgi:LmbE family N-acetylglucosaminyl deacetylase